MTYKSVAITLTSHDGMKSVIGVMDHRCNNEDVTQSRLHPIEIWTIVRYKFTPDMAR